MAVSIGELFVSLGFDVDDGKLKSFNDRIVTARNDVIKLTGAATAAVAAITGLITGPIERASTFKQFQDQFGYSADGLQKWARVASTVNNTLSFDQALGKYKAFAEYVQNAQFGGGGQALSALGADVKAGTTPDQYLEQLSNAAKSGVWQQRFGNNWRSAVAQYLGQTGLGTDYLDALMTTASQRDTMTKGRIQSPADIAKLDEINTKFHDIQRAYEQFAQQMTIQYGPQILAFLQAFLEKLPEIIKDIKDIVAEANKLAQAIGGWKTVGELVLAWYATSFAIGMIATLARVSTGLVAMGATSKGIIAGLAEFLGGGGMALTGMAAFGLGAAIPVGLDKLTGWGQKFADFVSPVPAWPGANAAQPRDPPVVNQDVTINVHSTADPKTVADHVVKEFQARTQRDMMQTLGQINLGGSH